MTDVTKPKKTTRKKSEASASDGAPEPEGTRPRLKRLSIENFRSISKPAVSVDLDDIVVLVGPNNAGKSTILRAYELVMSDGSAASKIALPRIMHGRFESGASARST